MHDVLETQFTAPVPITEPTGGRAALRGSGSRTGSRQRPPEKVTAELQAAGYVLVATHGFLPRQYFLVFQGKPS